MKCSMLQPAYEQCIISRTGMALWGNIHNSVVSSLRNACLKKPLHLIQFCCIQDEERNNVCPACSQHRLAKTLLCRFNRSGLARHRGHHHLGHWTRHWHCYTPYYRCPPFLYHFSTGKAPAPRFATSPGRSDRFLAHAGAARLRSLFRCPCCCPTARIAYRVYSVCHPASRRL